MPDYVGMENWQAIIPAPPGSEGYVELSRTRQGRVFRKHILNLGKDVLIHPETGKRLTLDDAWFNQLRRNFHDKSVVDIVQFPVADDRNKHVETPLSNLGEVLDVERDGRKVYAVIDVRKNADDVGKTILGASAMLHMDYKRSTDGKRVGPALVHVCATNRPYITRLDDYSEVIAASRDDSADMDFDETVVLTTEEAVPQTKEELIAALKADHGIDVDELQAAASQRADLSGLADALKGSLGLTGDDLAQSDVVGAIVELNAKNERLEGQVTELTRKDAERVVDGFIGQGRLLPKARSKAVRMYLSDGQDGIEDFLAPVDEPFIKMNHQEGVTGEGDGERQHDFDIDTEIQRLTGVAGSLGGTPGGRK